MFKILRNSILLGLLLTTVCLGVKPHTRLRQEPALFFSTAPAAANAGTLAFNTATNTPWYSDGSNWVDLGISASNPTEIQLQDETGAIQKFDIGSTQSSRNTALSDALDALTDNDILYMPTVSQRFEIGPKNLTFSNAAIFFSGEVKNLNTTQDYLLRITGDNNVINGMNGFVDTSFGDGSFLLIVGNYNKINNLRCTGTSLTSTGGFAYLESQTAVGNRVTNTYCKNVRAGMEFWGTGGHLENAVFVDSTGPHAVLCSSNVDEGTFSCHNVLIDQDDDAPNTPDSFGGMNLSPMDTTPGQFNQIKVSSFVYNRRGTINSAINITPLKFNHIKNLIIEGSTIDAPAVVGGGSLAITLFSAGVHKDFDNVLIDGCNFNVPILQTGIIDNFTIRNSRLNRGNQVLPRYLTSSTCDNFICEDSVLEGGPSGELFFNFTNLGSARFTRIRYDCDSNAILFNAQNGFDLNKVMVDGIDNVNGSRFLNNFNDNNLILAKLPGTFNRYTATGGVAPDLPTSGHSLSLGARGISDNLSTTSDYYYNGAAWVAMAAPVGTQTVVNQPDNAQSQVDVINSYNNNAVIGPNPTVVANTFYSTFDRTTGVQLDYVANALATGWIQVVTSGGATPNVDIINTSTLLTANYDTVLIDASSNAVSANLPQASTVIGKIYSLKAIDITNPAQTLPDGAETIDGSTPYTFSTANESIHIQSDGSNWVVLASNTAGGGDGVVSNVQLVGTDLIFTGASGGFNNTIDLSTLPGASSTSVTHKGSGVQSEVEKINVYADQASIGPSPTVVANTTYSTLQEDTGEINSYVSNAAVTAWIQVGVVIPQASIALTPGQTSVNVDNLYSVIITSATSETITDLNGGVDGQHVTVHFTDANVSVSSSSGFDLDTTDGNYTAQTGGATFVFEKLIGGTWREVSRRIF